MAKVSGLGLSITVDDSAGSGRDISNDIVSANWKTNSGEQNITGLDKSGMERLLLQADGQLSLTGVFNSAANKSHAVFKDYRTLAASQVGRTVVIAGVSGLSLSMEMVISDYTITRGANGELTWSATLSLSDGTVPTYS